MQRIAFLVAATLLLVATPARASDPVGVYALVDGVNNNGNFYVRGWFTLANQNNGQYFAPTYGYMLYACPQGMAATCMMEWGDITKSINSGSCAGWGGRYLNNGTVRPINTPIGNPDPYPIQMGVVVTMMGQCPGLIAAGGSDGGGIGSSDAGGVKQDASTPSDMTVPADLTMSAVNDLAVGAGNDLAMGATRDLSASGGDMTIGGGTGGGCGCVSAPSAPSTRGLALAACALLAGALLVRRRRR